MFKEWAEYLEENTFNRLGFKLSEKQTLQFCRYGDLLLEWNQRMNLTSIIEPKEVIVKHFIDSLALAKYLSGSLLADIGTGAGFPGIPLKIFKPDLEVVLVDSLAKRLSFLQEVISQLDLAGINILHARAEEFGRKPNYRENFDNVTARAVARLPVLLEYTVPLLKIKGFFLAAKGTQVDEEIAESKKALEVLGARVKNVERFNLGLEAEHRAVVVIEKLKPSPQDYPRKAGIPEKKPLI